MVILLSFFFFLSITGFFLMRKEGQEKRETPIPEDYPNEIEMVSEELPYSYAPHLNAESFILKSATINKDETIIEEDGTMALSVKVIIDSEEIPIHLGVKGFSTIKDGRFEDFITADNIHGFLDTNDAKVLELTFIHYKGEAPEFDKEVVLNSCEVYKDGETEEETQILKALLPYCTEGFRQNTVLGSMSEQPLTDWIRDKDADLPIYFDEYAILLYIGY